MNNICRVILTTECTKKCTYCCNKLPEVQQSFKFSTYDTVIEKLYNVFNVSGGEPLLVQDKLLNFAKDIRARRGFTAKLYLYTTGYIPNKVIESDVKERISVLYDGINIGIHDKLTENNKLMIKDWLKYISADRIRVHINNEICSFDDRQWCFSNGLELKLWKMNECDNDNEDRFII